MSYLLSIALCVSPIADDPLDQAMGVLDDLSGSLISVMWDETPLDEIVADLDEMLPVDVHADWGALERLAVDPRDRVSFSLHRRDAHAVLSGLALSLGDELERPVFDVHAGRIVLTVLDATEAMRLTGVYDVRDLLDTPIESIENASEVEPVEIETPELPVVPGAIELPDVVLADDREPTPAERLLLLVTEHVDPEAWMNFGGTRGRITDVEGVLVVTASPMTHWRLRQAFERLRAANPRNVHLDVEVAEIARDRWTRARDAATRASLFDGETIVWRSGGEVALGSSWSAKSDGADFAITPTHGSDGDVTLDIEASIESRTVSTRVQSRGRRDRIVVEMPGAVSEAVTVVRIVLERR